MNKCQMCLADIPDDEQVVCDDCVVAMMLYAEIHDEQPS